MIKSSTSSIERSLVDLIEYAYESKVLLIPDVQYSVQKAKILRLKALTVFQYITVLEW